jgi:hypothetical protein
MNAVMRRVLPFVAAVALAGCAGAGTGFNAFRRRVEPPRLEVINNNFSDATIWAVFPATRIRLGTVTGKSTGRFQLSPEHLFEPVYLQIDMVGGARCTTDTLTLDEGDRIHLEIVRDLSARPECAGLLEDRGSLAAR